MEDLQTTVNDPVQNEQKKDNSSTTFYFQDGSLWSLSINGPSCTREVEMDEDDWEQEDQYVFDDTDGPTHKF